MMMGGGYGQQPQQPHPPPPTFDGTGTPTSIFNPAMAVPDPVGPPPTSGGSAPPGAQPMDRPNMMMPPHSAGPGWNDPPPSVMNTTAKKSAITKPTAVADPITSPIMSVGPLPQAAPADPYGMPQQSQQQFYNPPTNQGAPAGYYGYDQQPQQQQMAQPPMMPGNFA